ncbi:MAG: succinate dehydrogenase assembly factor 2 [Burkholderiaceae bacterium]
MDPVPHADIHQADPKRRARLRWRSRRGLLENDILLTRFLDRHETTLTDDDVGALTQLLELSDNDLMDLILARSELSAELERPATARLVALLRSV